MELSDIFRIVNLAVGAITVLGEFQNIIIGAYMIVFGLSIALLEFQIPPQIARYANFLFSLIGRGVFYIFVGSMLLGKSTLSYISGGSVGIIGIGYVVLEFIPSIEPPANMREAEAGWGAEQV
ncbi:Golgi apparatus membrane protein tvp15 [Cladobotryum mycophilum]|uniref:Golgi apparatus membrane protein tvp15 n=1 Tax=Cladobotryum mycophilum TaxID=491253 RepID=A0ABR0T3L8_9HYPO